MSTYRRYQDARDTAWRALLQLDVRALPVDAEALAGRLGMEIHPFPDAQADPRLAMWVGRAGSGVCVSLRIRGAWHVFVRDSLSENERRFAVAHELGHLLLSHGTRSLAPGIRAFQSPENEGDLMADPQELDDYAADIFAIRLLAPACVLHELHVDQAGQITALCGLPPRAAALRAERMELLNERDAFFTHPLEKQVRDRFLPFLRSRQTAGTLPLPDPPEKRPLLTPLPERTPKEECPETPAAPAQAPARKRAGLWLPLLCLAAAAGLILFFFLTGR